MCNLVNNVALGYVVHTIIQETIYFSKHNQREAYKNLTTIVLEPPGWLINLRENGHSSTLYKAKLHNPIENIAKNARNVN